MTGQITLFEIMEQIKEPKWAMEISKGLKEHCVCWGYDWIERLQFNKSKERFFQLFCRVTKTYYIDIGDDYYNAEFQKDGKVVIKRCGADYNKRNEDAIIDIEDVLKIL